MILLTLNPNNFWKELARAWKFASSHKYNSLNLCPKFQDKLIIYS